MSRGDARLDLAARNIADLVGVPPSRCALVVHCEAKATVASAIAGVLRGRGLEVRQVPLPARADAQHRAAAAPLGPLTGDRGLVLLPGPEHAAWLFEAVGRPDRGIPAVEHLFCDWLLPADSLLRLYAVDAAEQARFRRCLLSRLRGVRRIRVTTPAGTDLELTPRDWERPDPVGWGEVYTAPAESSAEGVLVVDGSAYSGPPESPFVLRITGGRVANLDELRADDSHRHDPHRRLALADLTRDAAASVVAELGLGLSLGACPSAHIMEAEQARGTCHLGFGHDAAFGGRNESATHVDYCCLAPTIVADGETICRHGAYAL